MDPGKLIIGLALTLSVFCSLAALRIPPIMGDEGAFIVDLCVCLNRPQNVTHVYFFGTEVVVMDGFVVLDRLVYPVCANASLANNTALYMLPVKGYAVFRGWVKVSLYSVGNGTCIIKKV